ncbi:MAG: aromatic ring-hydroxylating dioxygenase subunit alpha [Proteobacteria bacterium]|nr:MAG: aromatic ring-hydroxylating dioxygenase subunit alpha [Pseudomonadota bacterium]
MDNNKVGLLEVADIIDRVFDHIDNGTTDLGTVQWHEPVEHYTSQSRYEKEIALLRQRPVVFCPSAAIPDAGSYISRTAAGTPLLVVRDNDLQVRAFINACRHRGMKVASGEGCTRTFSCPYHGWTYNLDGSLRGVPGEAAFPDLDKETSGLKEVFAVEKGGLIYVQQEGEPRLETLETALDFFEPSQSFFYQSDTIDEANWKLLTETLLEGYHIKSLHRESFYPFGLDNVNVVESYGQNSRVIYPFKRIEKLRSVARDERNIEGSATLVYHLFPNVSVSVLSKHTSVTVIEPLSPTRTQMFSYAIKHAAHNGVEISQEDAIRDVDFVNQSGQEEDRAAARDIQETVTTSANSHLTFGYYEKAIVSFHQQLQTELGET